ncbi:MAG: hypothetical protein MR627_07025 [Prevotella sp.]|nr:hypothetical protein [Prevotella sp.]
MDKRIATELIKLFENINFTEHFEGDEIVGSIQDHDRIIQVSFLGDNMGKYLKLSYTVEINNNLEDIQFNLSSRIVNGRYSLVENSIVLYSIVPMLDERFVGKQLEHALSEIWDMTTIVRHFNS